MERMVTLMRFESPEQAEYHLDMLLNAGIDAVIKDESIDDPPEPHSLPEAGGPVALCVPEEQAKEAGEVLEEGFDDNMGSNPSVR